MFLDKKFILASRSKSRVNILKKNKLSFFQVLPNCNEDLIIKKNKKQKKTPKQISLILAKTKARSIGQKNKQLLVVGSDTVIELNNKIIRKARNMASAQKKLKKLSGKEHNIYSSAVAYYNNKLVWKKTQKTAVKIRKINNKEIKNYLHACGKDILNSVGCYQIEKRGPNIIEYIKGDYFNVMGFPLFPFLFFLKKFSKKND